MLWHPDNVSERTSQAAGLGIAPLPLNADNIVLGFDQDATKPDSPCYYLVDELTRPMNTKCFAMRLPRDDVSEILVFGRLEHEVKLTKTRIEGKTRVDQYSKSMLAFACHHHLPTRMHVGCHAI
jgi:hypothetical protein